MKRLLTLAAMFLCCMATTFAQFSGSGSGTENDPYRIYNENQLSQVSNFLNQEGVVFELMKDMNLANWISENNPNQGWLPIGIESSPFKGKFYGNNHKISGLSIRRNTENNVGFFGYLTDATIQDLSIEGRYIIGKNYVGGFAAQINTSNVSNISITLSDEEGIAGNDYTGGFSAKIQSSTITDCNVVIIGRNGVMGNNYIGGFSGTMQSSSLTNCHVTIIENDGVTGNVDIGGFSGNSQGCTLTNFSLKTNVNSVSYGAGVIGQVDGGVYKNGSFEGNIHVTEGSGGGFAAKAKDYELSNISTTGNIGCFGNDCNVGGIIGISEGSGKVNECVYKGDLSANNKAGSGEGALGGIIGSAKGGGSVALEKCFSKGHLNNNGNYTGGIIGLTEGACISNMESCSHFGDIKGIDYVGGLIGAILCKDIKPELSTYYIYSSTVSAGTYVRSDNILKTFHETIKNGEQKVAAINNCVSIGNLSGNNSIGGLIGSDLSSFGYTPGAETTTYNNNSCYYMYLVKGNIYIGRFHNTLTFSHSYYRNSISYSLTNNYYSGTIQGTNYVGGLVGIKGGGEIRNNYSYATIFGATNVGGIIGATTAQINENSFSKVSIKSNVANCQILSATNSNLGRIYGVIEDQDKNYVTIGALGSTEGNKALAQTRIILQGVVQEYDDDLQNGTSIGSSLLRLKATYVSMGWDYDNDWNILETESYPYKKYQAAPPVIKSNLVSQATSISGLSINGGTVYLFYKDRDAVSTVCEGHNWSFVTEPLQSGALVQVYADGEGMTPSHFTTANVGYPGSGIEDDPYRIYTAEDLQGASNRGYYKLMNDIDLTTWINENSPTEGWPAIGRNSGEATYIDGDGHKVTGLWMNTTQNYNGLFSNFSAGQIKNLTVEVAKGKKVKGGDYTGILIGRNANGRLLNCTVKGTVEGKGHVGGMVGYAENTTISTISANANITGTTFVGGIAGQAMNCAMTTCYAATTITCSGANSKVGGLVGYAKGSTISKCSTQNNLIAADESNYVGGLVGYSETPVSYSFSTGDVTATGNDSYSGGLVGYAFSPVENSYSTANTNGTLYTAGLVGYTFSSIDKCYAKGNVNGMMCGSGVVGYLDGPTAFLTNSVACSNILSLTGQSAWGNRVIGGFKNGADEPDNTNYALSTMQVSVNDFPQTKTDDPLEGIAKTEAELKAKATYQGLGWDMENVWTIVEGEGYPTLKENENSGGNQEEPDDFQEGVNTLFGSDLQASAGKTAVLPIILNNENEVKLCQFDLQLPTGVIVATKSNGKLDATLTERAESHSITGKQLSNGDYRFVISSMDNESFTGNSGTLLEITIDVPATMEGEYTVKVLNVELSVPNGNELKVVKPADTQSKLIVSSFILGDVNNDGSVSVTDVGCVINYILEQVPSVFVFDAADMNGDKSISVTDVGMIINLILNEGSAASPQLNRAAAGNAQLTQERTTEGYQLQLENKDAFIGFQMDLQLANGATIKSMKLIGGDNHLMTYRQLDNGCYRVVCYSPTNSTFEGNEVGLLNISTTGDVTISNVRLTTTDFNEVRLDAVSGGTTDITDRLVNQNEKLKVYTLDGRLCRVISRQSGENPLNGLKPGVYMIGNRKVVVR